MPPKQRSSGGPARARSTGTGASAGADAAQLRRLVSELSSGDAFGQLDACRELAKISQVHPADVLGAKALAPMLALLTQQGSRPADERLLVAALTVLASLAAVEQGGAAPKIASGAGQQLLALLPQPHPSHSSSSSSAASPGTSSPASSAASSCSPASTCTRSSASPSPPPATTPIASPKTAATPAPATAAAAPPSDAVVQAAAAAIAAIAADLTTHPTLCGLGAVPALFEVLRSGSDQAQEAATKALGNLAAGFTGRQAIVASGQLPALVDRLGGSGPSAQAKGLAAEALVRLLQGSPASQRAVGQVVVEAGALPMLVELLRVRLVEAREASACALAMLTLRPSVAVAVATAPGAVRALTELLALTGQGAAADAARAAAAAALGNLLRGPQDCGDWGAEERAAMAQGGRGPEEVRQRALDAGAVPALLRLLSSKHAETVACASSCLLYLRRHAPARAAAVACGGLVPLAEHLRSGPPRLQKEAAWMLHLVGNHSTEGKAQLKEVGMLRHPAVLRAAVEWEAYRMQHALQL